MGRSVLFSTPVVVWIALSAVVFADERLQCKNSNGQSVDWFTAIKLPNLENDMSDGTVYVYMDSENLNWTYLKNIIKEESAIGHTVAQMYAPTENYNNTLMWIVYNDEPTNRNLTASMGHSKGVVVADNSSGFWLVHSVPKFPKLPYQNNNSYTYPSNGVSNGQSFLCMSMMAQELDKVGNQLINNEVLVYGSHFGNDLKEMYPTLYNATLKHKNPSKKNDGVRLQDLQSIKSFKFLSISKNRYFRKDLYEDLLTHITQSNVYTETWLNSRNSFNSSCTTQYKAMNVKSLSMKSIKGLETCWYNSSKDHSKWMVTSKSSVPWTCIGDINRALGQTKRGGGTVCIDSIAVWNQYNKLLLGIEKCENSDEISNYLENNVL